MTATGACEYDDEGWAGITNFRAVREDAGDDRRRMTER